MALLPQELFDAIIDEIHDKEMLKACALVSSSFLPPSRRKLFRKVQLGGRGQHSRDTSADLAEFPHLVSYIRDLILVIPSTVPNSVAVAGVLRSVQNIESLVVFGIQWNRLEHEVCSALLDCLSRPSLQRLDLYHMEGVPTALIFAATAIPVACFYYVHTDMHEEISEQLHASAPAPRLRHLILGGPGHVVLPVCNFLLHPRKPASTQQIERLEIRLSQDSASYAEQIMAACAATLKGLVFHPTDLIRLPLLPFVLEVEIKVSVNDNRRLPAFFSHNFSQIASSLPLAETITLVVFVDLPLGPEIEWPDEGPLPVFGPSFMDRTQLLHLRRVHCILRRQSTFISAVFDRFVTAMDSMMPGLRGTGILRCTLDNPHQ